MLADWLSVPAVYMAAGVVTMITGLLLIRPARRMMAKMPSPEGVPQAQLSTDLA
ncbi:MAG: hypothetical protein ACM3ZA_05460 [Bacillota bacterium]